MEGERIETRVVIYEVSKTLYTPTRQRAGLAPRNPVLALTHRYLSHDHFQPIRARGGARTHTYVHGASSTLHAGVFTIYSAPRVGNAVGYLVDIVYLGYSPPHDPRDFSFRLSPPVRKKRQRDDCLAPGPPVSVETNGPVAHIGIRSAPIRSGRWPLRHERDTTKATEFRRNQSLGILSVWRPLIFACT